METHYSADVTDIVGQVAGPDLHGALYEAVSATYDEDAGRTTVRWRPISPNDPREIVADAFGIWRVVDG